MANTTDAGRDPDALMRFPLLAVDPATFVVFGMPAADAAAPRRGGALLAAGRPQRTPLPHGADGPWSGGRSQAPRAGAARPSPPTSPGDHASPTGAPRPDARTGSPTAAGGGVRAPYQEGVLNSFRHAAEQVEVRCQDGGVLVGVLVNFDTYSLVLDTPGGPTLVFKHAVTYVRRARSEGSGEARPDAAAGGAGPRAPA